MCVHIRLLCEACNIDEETRLVLPLNGCDSLPDVKGVCAHTNGEWKRYVHLSVCELIDAGEMKLCDVSETVKTNEAHKTVVLSVYLSCGYTIFSYKNVD
jgi:hypothetical protein